jgi:hypothetical protein
VAFSISLKALGTRRTLLVTLEHMSDRRLRFMDEVYLNSAFQADGATLATSQFFPSTALVVSNARGLHLRSWLQVQNVLSNHEAGRGDQQR